MAGVRLAGPGDGRRRGARPAAGAAADRHLVQVEHEQAARYDAATQRGGGRHEVDRAGRVRAIPRSPCGPGADQVFARAVLDVGGLLHVVIPAARYRDGFEDEDAKRGYDEPMDRATYAEPPDDVESTGEAHMAGGRAVVDRSDLPAAAWDAKPARGHGGTADVVAYARGRGVPVEVVWPEGASRD
jgi:hypothetical protein